MNSRTRRFLQALALGVMALGVGVVVAELALRVTGAAPGRGGVFTVSSAEFEQIPGIFGRNQEAEVSQIPQLRYRVRIDSLGYRGQSLPRSKPERGLRILYVGDSLVFGDYVDDHETLPAQTEAALASRCRAPVRVVNAGLGGSTITEHAKMVERGLSLDPDLVILQFSENDVTDLAGEVMWYELARNRRAKSRFPLSVIYPFVRGSALWNLGLRAVARMREREVVQRSSVSEDDDHGVGASGHRADEGAARAEIAQYRTQYAERLMRLQASLAVRKIPLVVAIMPSHLSVYGLWDSDQLSWLDGLVRELEIDAVSFFPTFRADGRPETELYLLPHDGHASPAGYQIAAQQLTERLIGLRPYSEHCQ